MIDVNNIDLVLVTDPQIESILLTTYTKAFPCLFSQPLTLVRLLYDPKQAKGSNNTNLLSNPEAIFPVNSQQNKHSSLRTKFINEWNQSVILMTALKERLGCK